MNEDNSTLLNKKNTNAVVQSLDHLNKMVYEQQIRIDLLQTSVANLLEKVVNLEQMLVFSKAMSFGHGPSVK